MPPFAGSVMMTSVVCFFTHHLLLHVFQGEPVEVPNPSQGFGGVNLASTLVTPLSPPGLQLKVYGKWTHDCSACPFVSKRLTGQTYRLRVSCVATSDGRGGGGEVPKVAGVILLLGGGC